MKLSAFKTDQKKEVEGVEFTTDEGLVLTLARANNVKFVAHMLQMTKARVNAARGMSGEDLVLMQKRATATHILLGWENLQDDDGNDIPYSFENVLIALDIPDFYAIVQGLSQERDKFLLDDAQVAEGN